MLFIEASGIALHRETDKHSGRGFSTKFLVSERTYLQYISSSAGFGKLVAHMDRIWGRRAWGSDRSRGARGSERLRPRGGLPDVVGAPDRGRRHLRLRRGHSRRHASAPGDDVCGPRHRADARDPAFRVHLGLRQFAEPGAQHRAGALRRRDRTRSALALYHGTVDRRRPCRPRGASKPIYLDRSRWLSSSAISAPYLTARRASR